MSRLTVLAPYRWVFVTIALGALGYAGYEEWRRSCRPACDCDGSPWSRRLLLGIGAGIVLAVIVSPGLLSSASTTPSASASDSSSPAPTAEAETHREVVLTVENMTCATCPATVRTALERVPGVRRVTATYEPPRATVQFDATRTTVEVLTEATAQAGYPSHLQSP